MKCPHCGGEIGLEDRECPFCGRLNEQSAQHSRDMAHFKKRYLETEAAVEGKNRRLSQILPRTIVFCVLLVASIACLLIGQGAWGFPMSARKKAALRDPAATCAKMDAYLAQGDYIAFDSFMDWNNISTYSNEAFRPYYFTNLCAGEYAEVIRSMETIFLRRDYDSWTQKPYYDGGEFRILCLRLENFYEAIDQAMQEETDSRFLGYISDMEQTVNSMLAVYFGIDGDELEEFLGMGVNQQTVYLEEVLFHEK